MASMVTKNRAVKWDGVAKIDLTAEDGAGDACIGRIRLPPGHHNGETVFVPRWVEKGGGAVCGGFFVQGSAGFARRCMLASLVWCVGAPTTHVVALHGSCREASSLTCTALKYVASNLPHPCSAIHPTPAL